MSVPPPSTCRLQVRTSFFFPSPFFHASVELIVRFSFCLHIDDSDVSVEEKIDINVCAHLKNMIT